MKRWIVPLASLSAVAGVIALALLLAGVFDGDGAARAGAGNPEAAGTCLEGTTDCEDTLVAPDGATDGGEGATIAPVCAPGFPDCVDTVVGDGDPGQPDEGQDGVSIAPACAPGSPDCVDTIVIDPSGDNGGAEPPAVPYVPADGDCSGEGFGPCVEQAIIAAVTDAEGRFAVDESMIVVESTAFQEWSNSCLGAAAEGEACAEVITPGFVVVIEVEGSSYEYHTDLNGNVRLAA